MGSGGGASGRAVALCPDDPSLILLGFFSCHEYQWHVLNQVPRVGATLTDFLNNRLSCAA